MRRLIPVLAVVSAVAFPLAAARAASSSDELAQGDALVKQWLEGKATDAVPVFEQALKDGADEYEVRWREAGAYFWQGEGLDVDKDSDKLKELGLKCVDVAQKAAALKPDRVEGNYYVAVCWGEYSHGISIIKALGKGVEGKFKSAASKAEKIDPTFLDGAPLNAWGRFYYELPWPKRDLDKSATYLKRNVDATPCNLRTRLYYAETLLKRDDKGDKDEAKTQLQYIADHDHCADNPDDGVLSKKRAAAVAASLK